MRNPMQPFVMDGEVVRFKANKIVSRLLEIARRAGWNLNNLADESPDFSQDDYEQFVQLIGYSLIGFHELSGVSDETAFQATQNARIQFKKTVSGCRDNGCDIHSGVTLQE